LLKTLKESLSLKVKKQFITNRSYDTIALSRDKAIFYFLRRKIEMIDMTFQKIPTLSECYDLVNSSKSKSFIYKEETVDGATLSYFFLSFGFLF